MDGWIRLSLYLKNLTERMWRLSAEGEIRTDSTLMWQNYTGSITIPLSKMKDIWIKYTIEDKVVTIPPAGTMLVDIVPDPVYPTKAEEININISYDIGCNYKRI